MYFMSFYRILQYIDIIIYIMNTNSLDPITMYVYRIDDIYDKLNIHLVYVYIYIRVFFEWLVVFLTSFLFIFWFCSLCNMSTISAWAAIYARSTGSKYEYVVVDYVHAWYASAALFASVHSKVLYFTSTAMRWRFPHIWDFPSNECERCNSQT